MYGLSGSSGVHPCLHCTATKASIKQLQSSSIPHPIPTTLRSGQDTFVADGARMPRAKLFRNVVRPALLPIAVDHAALPALHLDLGIYMRLYNALLKDCCKLDLKLAKAAHTTASGSDFADFVKVSEVQALAQSKETKAEELWQQLTALERQLHWVGLHHQIMQDHRVCPQTLARGLQQQYQLVNDKATPIQRELDQLNAQLASASISDGPCASSLEPALQ